MTTQQALEIAVGHHQAGRWREADQMYREVLAKEPGQADALHLLGVLAHQFGQNDAAVELIGKAIGQRANFPVAYYNLGMAYKALGRVAEAMAAWRKAIELHPDYAEAYNSLGVVLVETGRNDEAGEAFRKSLALKPDYAEAHMNVGNMLSTKGQMEEAITAYRNAVRFKPDYAEAYSNLAQTLQEAGRLDEAIPAFQRALALRPDMIDRHINLGNIRKDKGQMAEAVAAYRQALALKPSSVEAHGNLIYALHYHGGYDARGIAEECGRWNRQHAEPLKKFIQAHDNDRNSARRLRIGYVSPDFREHPVGRFLLPLWAHHDKKQFAVFAYAQVPSPDALTERLRGYTDGWRTLVGVSDAQAADLIRHDRIDILVDLTMHTANNRLLVFARKPAPVQVTYLAYCSSTGLDAMDYRLSDRYLDPEDGDETVYSEKTIRLPDCYWCYQPLGAPPDVGPLPALETGHITLGCLNNFCKVSELTLALWAKVLRAMPGAQFLLHAHLGSHRDELQARMAREGIAPGRVRFVGKVSVGEYFGLYQQIDLALDTIPYGGGTTTCDALWMGVPVVSLVGKTGVGRAGLSILSNLGLPELAAHSEEEYVAIAVALGHDLDRLGALRATLRGRMERSPLMDAPRFARGVEAAYRQMWRNWCAGGGNGNLAGIDSK